MVNLDVVRRFPYSVGSRIYEIVILEQSLEELGKHLCCLDPDQSKKCERFDGRWIRTLTKGKKKGRSHLVEIDGELKVLKIIGSRDHWSSYRNADIFNLEELRRVMTQNVDLSKQCLGVTDIDYQYIGMDDFANETMVGAAVDEAFASIRNPRTSPEVYSRIEQVAMCDGRGLILTDHAEYGDLHSFSRNLPSDMVTTFGEQVILKPEHTTTIIKQIAAGLDFLQTKIQFIHSDLKVQNVLISSEPVKWTHKGVNVSSSKISARIADYGNASASLESASPVEKYQKKIRLFNEIRATRYLPGGTSNYKLSAQKKSNCFQVEIGSGRTGECGEAYWWKLPSSFNIKVSLITAHSGMPFYRSYDFYVFMVTLMMCPSMYYSVLSDQRLRGRAWDSIWLSEELDAVTKEVQKYHSGEPSLSGALSVLKKFHMRCDALKGVLKLLK